MESNDQELLNRAIWEVEMDREFTSEGHGDLDGGLYIPDAYWEDGEVEGGDILYGEDQ